MKQLELEKTMGELLTYTSQTPINNGAIGLSNFQHLKTTNYLGQSSTTELINNLISISESVPEAPWWD